MLGRIGGNCFEVYTVVLQPFLRLIGSFFAFDKQLPCSNKYTVYTRDVNK
jgi:hypothetical protein